MKILVFSDSHGHSNYIRDALRAHPGADCAVFLGDGVRDAEDAFRTTGILQCIILRGNCDSFLSFSLAGDAYPEELLLDFDGLRFLMLHGHNHGVKSGTGRLLHYAAARHADAVLYGHTHLPDSRDIIDHESGGKHIFLFNPGSIGMSYTHSYGVIEVKNGRIHAAHHSAVQG